MNAATTLNADKISSELVKKMLDVITKHVGK